ncbi:hypothetical protein [Prevotella rectalis]|nr:hypothetical protein [Prevotella brunnea]
MAKKMYLSDAKQMPDSGHSIRPAPRNYITKRLSGKHSVTY